MAEKGADIAPEASPTIPARESDEEATRSHPGVGNGEEAELAGTRRLFNRNPVTGEYDENIILSPQPTKSPYVGRESTHPTQSLPSPC